MWTSFRCAWSLAGLLCLHCAKGHVLGFFIVEGLPRCSQCGTVLEISQDGFIDLDLAA